MVRLREDRRPGATLANVGRYENQILPRRPIDHLVADAGFELTKLSTYYRKRPSADGYAFEGAATKPARD